MAVIPGGLTSVLQPLDVCLNKPFKDHQRKMWVEWMTSGSAMNQQLKVKPRVKTMMTTILLMPNSHKNNMMNCLDNQMMMKSLKDFK